MLVPPYYFNTDDILTVDIETDAIHGYKTIHCIVAKDLEGTVTKIIQPLERPDENLKLVNLLEKHKGGSICGHYFLGFDYPAMDFFMPGLLDRDKVIDSLVLSKLLNFSIPGGHSIEAWGPRLGLKKAHAGLEDFSVFTEDMLERCVSDVEVNWALLTKRLLRFLRDPEWHYPIWLEHQVAKSCRDMHVTGLPFDKADADVLKQDIQKAIEPIDKQIVEDYPPNQVLVRSFTTKTTQKGTLNAQDFRWAQTREFEVLEDRGEEVDILLLGLRSSGIPDLSCFKRDQVVNLYDLEFFNPGSVRQIVHRMNEAGWKPTEKTKGHINALKDKSTPRDKLEQFKEYGWKVCEENLQTLPDTAPAAAKKLAQRLILASRLSYLDEWINVVREDGRVHTEFNSIGAWTHRGAHSKPNSANMPVAKRSSKDTEFETFVNDINDRMRGLVRAPKGKVLVGSDADGVQMRIFAHLVNDPRLIKALIEGSKDDGTDIHTLHKGFLGEVCKSRDTAKTFIYAFLLGAGTGKVAEILQATVGQAKTAVNHFLSAYPGLKELKESVIPRDAERGYFIGLDGRKVACSSEHLMLSGYLQNGEKIIMATAEQFWRKDLEDLGIPYELVNWVHDEWQTLVEDNPEVIKVVKQVQIQSFVKTGEFLNLNCPLNGSSDHGYTWKETH